VKVLSHETPGVTGKFHLGVHELSHSQLLVLILLTV